MLQALKKPANRTDFQAKLFEILSCPLLSLRRWPNPKFTHPEPFTRHSTVDHPALSQIQIKDLAPKWDLFRQERNLSQAWNESFLQHDIGVLKLCCHWFSVARTITNLKSEGNAQRFSLNHECLYKIYTYIYIYIQQGAKNTFLHSTLYGYIKGSIIGPEVKTKQSSHGHGVCPAQDRQVNLSAIKDKGMSKHLAGQRVLTFK